MTTSSKPPDRDDFERRLNERLEARKAPRKKGIHAAAAGLGLAWRLSLEFVAAFAIGGLMGFGLDKLTGLAPLFLLIGFGFGFAAGVLLVVRTSAELDATVDTAAGEDKDGGERRGG